LRCSVTGNWLFSNRRWLCPADPSDRCLLEANYDKLCSLHPEFSACSKEDFLEHLTEVTSAWAKIMSDCRLRPTNPGDLSGSAAESEIHKEIEDFQKETLRTFVMKRRRPSAEDGSSRPKTAHRESPSDSSWLGCMQDGGHHDGMTSDHAQPQPNPPGDGSAPHCPPQACPIAQQARRALPSPCAFAPCTQQPAHFSDSRPGASPLREVPTWPCTIGPEMPFRVRVGPWMIQEILGGSGRTHGPDSDPSPVGTSALRMAALRRPGLGDCDNLNGAQDSDWPPVALPWASGAAQLCAASIASSGPGLRGGSEPALAAHIVAGAVGPSAFTSRDRPATAFTAVVRPKARQPAASPALRHFVGPTRAAPTPIQPAPTRPLLRAAAPQAWPPGPGAEARPQLWPSGSEPPAHIGAGLGEGGAGNWPGSGCGGSAVAAGGHRSPPHGGRRTAPDACLSDPSGPRRQPAWGQAVPWWEGQARPGASGRPRESDGGEPAVHCLSAVTARVPGAPNKCTYSQAGLRPASAACPGGFKGCSGEAAEGGGTAAFGGASGGDRAPPWSGRREFWPWPGLEGAVPQRPSDEQRPAWPRTAAGPPGACKRCEGSASAVADMEAEAGARTRRSGVQRWLTWMGLGRFGDMLLREGWDSVEVLQTMRSEDLLRLGVPGEEARRILRHLPTLLGSLRPSPNLRADVAAGFAYASVLKGARDLQQALPPCAHAHLSAA